MGENRTALKLAAMVDVGRMPEPGPNHPPCWVKDAQKFIEQVHLSIMLQPKGKNIFVPCSLTRYVTSNSANRLCEADFRGIKSEMVQKSNR